VRGGWTFVARTIALTLIAGAAGAATSGWTLVDLGTLGGPGSYGAAISQGGAVVGCADRADGTAHAFLYLNGRMRDLDAGSNGPGSSCALAVNDSGFVAGRSSSGALVIWSGSSVAAIRSVEIQRGTDVPPPLLMVTRIAGAADTSNGPLKATRDTVTSVSTKRDPEGTKKIPVETRPDTSVKVWQPLRMSAAFTWAAAGAARSSAKSEQMATERMGDLRRADR